MQLTPEERVRIYLEEKAKRETGGGASLWLLALTIGGILGLAALLTIATGSHEKEVSIDDLRKAYAGLSPEEEGQEP
jgi:hypothetical protein